MFSAMDSYAILYSYDVPYLSLKFVPQILNHPAYKPSHAFLSHRL